MITTCYISLVNISIKRKERVLPQTPWEREKRKTPSL
jgi:hypothetical protein